MSLAISRVPLTLILPALPFAVTVIVEPVTIMTSSVETGTIPPIQELPLFQFPPTAVLVIVAA
jgi:hypothetical protein